MTVLSRMTLAAAATACLALYLPDLKMHVSELSDQA